MCGGRMSGFVGVHRASAESVERMIGNLASRDRRRVSFRHAQDGIDFAELRTSRAATSHETRSLPLAMDGEFQLGLHGVSAPASHELLRASYERDPALGFLAAASG